ncbi:MAG: STAS domain-containing protein [Planctomycetales bacterium]
MQISTELQGQLVEMRVAGRLDNEWSGRLTEAIDEAVRDGSHSVLLDLTEVDYLSSAGISALVRAHKQFEEIHGRFGVGHASAIVLEIIQSTGLARLLLCDPNEMRRKAGGTQATIQPLTRIAAQWGTALDVYELEKGASHVCELFGDPTRLPLREYVADDCRSVEFPPDALGLGLGALARDFADGQQRLGEFLAVSGAVAQRPTSGGNRPDYQLHLGTFVPQVQVAYGLRCRGGFRRLFRFDAIEEQSRIPLSGLLDECLQLAESDLASVVLVGESAGLVGAALRRSPAQSTVEQDAKFEHPEVRNWLSYSPESLFPHAVALAVGVAARSARGPLGPLLRPLDRQGRVYGHMHAAVFSYRPFKKRKLDLEQTVSALFETEELQSVLHLLQDDREPSPRESQFVRGACWIAPISEVTGGVA